jgi:hypothetical protein
MLTAEENDFLGDTAKEIKSLESVLFLMNQFYHFYTSCKSADKIIVLFTNRFSLLIFAIIISHSSMGYNLDRVENRTLQNKTVEEKASIAFKGAGNSTFL